jgi:hypothetical protein
MRAPSLRSGPSARATTTLSREPVVGLYKDECVRIEGAFRTVDELELATRSWVHWGQREPVALIDRIPHTD